MSTENTIPPRLSGLARLYGDSGLDLLQQKRVMIVGLGGVGSWAAEALARSGVGSLVLVDFDDICHTNINRQVLATVKTVGQLKVDALEERLLTIAPSLEVVKKDCGWTPSSAPELLETKPNMVIDAIDSLKNKAHLIQTARQLNLPIVTCGGAGGRMQPWKVQVDDLNRTHGDRLLASLRKKLRKESGWSTGARWNIPCVFSSEEPHLPEQCEAGALNCQTGYGSLTSVTGTFGFFMASLVLETLLKGADNSN